MKAIDFNSGYIAYVKVAYSLAFLVLERAGIYILCSMI